MPSPATPSTWRRALRLHQWAKNLLVFAPLALAGSVSTFADLLDALAGFLALGLAASAVYLINDLRDLADDRAHPTKRHRPLAAGEISDRSALVAALLLLLLAAAIAAVLPSLFGEALAAYLATTLAYSFLLKRCPPFDVFLLGILYALRILAGMAFVPVPVSPWFLGFALLFFLSLALAKRYAETAHALDTGDTLRLHRGYRPADLPFILALGVSSGSAAMLVFMVYLILERSPATVYASPEMLWLVFPLLAAWHARIWLLTGRGEMHEDPVAFALRDPLSWGLGLLVVLCVLLAW
ncbi:UbiA prenyltransferase family protein [Tistlia consotensis]|uniref:UbiA prenyltransferase family protein n=1 Tax=Tistlia consotensis USBA 355 TaxID=560819 RepID=A0A1Y6BPM9_9PROT|nr:UbiA family prenyltransferase [Tistlia consotensis]SMF22046.1 UbiA prenyltransferase family protein [Tistlia consotensis USBA 355]SNR46347.1 UbiA prenyltransferase family protein [Tistlia consotensis]